MSICTRLRIESSLPEFARCARGARGARGTRGNGSQSAAQTPPGHTRRGLGLRELNKLPQNMYLHYISNYIGNPTGGNPIGNPIGKIGKPDLFAENNNLREFVKLT